MKLSVSIWTAGMTVFNSRQMALVPCRDHMPWVLRHSSMSSPSLSGSICHRRLIWPRYLYYPREQRTTQQKKRTCASKQWVWNCSWCSQPACTSAEADCRRVKYCSLNSLPTWNSFKYRSGWYSSFVYSISTLQEALWKMLLGLYIRRKTQFSTVHILYFRIIFKLLHSQVFWNDGSVALFIFMYAFSVKKKELCNMTRQKIYVDSLYQT